MASPLPPTTTPGRPQRTELEVPSTPIVDFSVIEGQKENIQPLSTGRSAHALSTVFGGRPKQLEKEHREARERFEEELREVEERRRKELLGEADVLEAEADPLDVYERYIRYVRDTAPSGSTQSSILIPLLERCTRTLLSEDVWSQDIRYLRIWIQYSRLIEAKVDVFQFLLSSEVGTDWSALYEEYAVVLEGMGQRSKADDTYKLGIARKAKPLERLKLRYNAFNIRMATPLPPNLFAPSVPDPDPSSRTRSTLGTLAGSSAPSLGSSSSSRPNGSSRKPGGMAIFVDGVEGGEAAEEDERRWHGQLGTRDEVRKENERESTVWKGETLPQGRGIAPRTPKLQIFKDDAEEPATPSAHPHAVDDVFSRAKAAPPEWEVLLKDPLRNMRSISAPSASSRPPPPSSELKPSSSSSKRHAALSSSSSKPPPAANPTGFITEMPKWEVPDSTPPLNKKGKPEVRKFKWDMVFRDGREWSFEECRARDQGVLGKNPWDGMDTNPSSKPKALSPPPAPPASYAPKPRTSLDQMPPPPTPLQRIPEPQPLPTPTPSSSMPPPPLPVQTPSHPRPAQPAQTPQAAAPEPTPKARRPSPTINTKAALADVMDMYNAGAGEDDEDEDDSDDSDDDDDFPPIIHIPETPVPPTPVPQVAQRLFQLPSVPPPTSNEDVFRDEPTAPVFRDDNTPSSSRQLQHKPASPAIFQDENAVPSSSRQAFGTTPQSRPPLSARKPSFEIFSDDAPASSAPPPPSATKTPFGEKTLAPLRETFATPMPESKQLRRGVGFASQPMTEEDEEEGDQAERLEEEEDEREYERSRGVWDGRVGAFELMTPITERTSEYARSSIGGATARSSMGGLGISEEDEEEGENATPLAAGNQGIFVDPPQDSVPSKMLDRLSIRDEDVAEDRDSFNRSSSVPFSVSDGYTIEGQTGQTASLMDTMNVVDPTSNEAPLSPPQPAEPTAAPYQPTPPRAPLPLPTHVVASPIRPSVAKAINFHSASPPSASTPPSGSNVPISIANPCNPMDPETMDLLIAALSPPLSDLPGFRDLTTKTSNLLDGLQKSAKAKVRRGSTGSSKSGAGGDRGMGEGLGTVDLGGVAFEVREKIGEGGFGAVFLARDVAADAAGRKKNGSDAGSDEEDEDEDGSDDEDEGASSLVALKIEKPAGIWEGLILDRVHSRLPSSLQSSIISSKGLYAFADESFLILSYSSQGTLLDAVNQASKLGIASSGAGGPAGMDELVVLFFTVELLRAVEALHRAHFIHGDLKIDNCLVRLDPIPGGPSSWSSQYDKEGGGGWASKGIKMIDFGKAIDMSLFPQEQTFIADWAVDARDCVEMREARPWSYQTDYFGLASICYCMLFGKYIETAVTPSEPGSIGKRYKIATPLKRYWQTDLWTRLFDLLLNPKAHRASLPIVDELRPIREEMAQQVADKCLKDGKNLRSLLKKLELNSLSR